MVDWDLESIDQSFQDAAFDPSKWNGALDLLSQKISAKGAFFTPVNGRTPDAVGSENLREAIDFYFRHDLHKKDLRDRLTSKLVARGVTTELDFYDTDILRREPYYQEFLATFGLKWFAGVRIQAGEDVWCLSIQRTDRQEPFTAAEQARLADFGQRISITTTLARNSGYAKAAGMADGLDFAGLGAVLLDKEGRVILMNMAAERMLDRDFQTERRYLKAADDASDRAVGRLIGQTLGRFGPASIPVPVAIQRAGRHPLVISALPLGGDADLAFGPARALLILRNLDRQNAPLQSELCSMFGLTQAESKIALALTWSEDALPTLSEKLGISVTTARTQLASVFRKTGTVRQSDLVRLLTRLGDRPPD